MFGYGMDGCCYPSYGYGNCGGRSGSAFALIVVLFILLIIVGCVCMN